MAAEQVSSFLEAQDKTKLIDLARLGEISERYDDMCRFMRALVEAKGETESLSTEERNLFSVAFKNVVGAKRGSLRALKQEREAMESGDAGLIESYENRIRDEIKESCQEVLDLIDQFMLKKVESDESEEKVFYLKMAADYCRYIQESQPPTDTEFGQKAIKYYKDAMDIADKTLTATNPTRLGLALNCSVCYYEILNEHKQAKEVAKKAFDTAIAQLDQTNDTEYKDSTLIMQLLRDNINLWDSVEQNDDAAAPDQS